jgi:hypothetical protein
MHLPFADTAETTMSFVATLVVLRKSLMTCLQARWLTVKRGIRHQSPDLMSLRSTAGCQSCHGSEPVHMLQICRLAVHPSITSPYQAGADEPDMNSAPSRHRTNTRKDVFDYIIHRWAILAA